MIFVSSYLDLERYGSQIVCHRDTYIEKARTLLIGLPLVGRRPPRERWVFFTDIPEAFGGLGDHVDLVPIDPAFVLDRASQVTHLPAGRQVAKDTGPYLMTQILKTAFAREALERHPEAPAAAWLDAGILKTVPDEPAFLDAVARVAALRPNVLMLPGFNVTVSEMTLETPIWSFAGGFFMGPRKSVQRFAALVESATEDLLAENALTWEVNLWHKILVLENAVPYRHYGCANHHEALVSTLLGLQGW